jgi:hypothetical protein
MPTGAAKKAQGFSNRADRSSAGNPASPRLLSAYALWTDLIENRRRQYPVVEVAEVQLGKWFDK